MSYATLRETLQTGGMQPDKLRARVKLWVDEEIAADALSPKAGIALDAIFYRGALLSSSSRRRHAQSFSLMP